MPLPREYDQGTTYDDFRGHTIRIGDDVVYAALSGRSCQLVEATVLDVAEQAYQDTINDGITWVWDRVKYARLYDDPNRQVIRHNERQVTKYRYKLRLQPTGRSSRWEQHSTYDNEWVNGDLVRVPKDIKPVWIMAENVLKVI